MSDFPQSLTLTYTANTWYAMDAEHQLITVDGKEDSELSTLPELPAESCVGMLVLPIEMLICRSLWLPLSHPRFLDHEVLAQELAEQSCEEADGWWLSWQAQPLNGGLQVLLLAMPESLRQMIQPHPAWQDLQWVGVDAHLRLNRWRGDIAENQRAALFDVDAEGLFFGVCDHVGSWFGMRRLNLDPGMPTASQLFDIRRSLTAMGWEEGISVHGTLTPGLLEALAFPDWQGNAVAVESLRTRYEETLGCQKSELNFRHGSWRPRSIHNQPGRWNRSVMLTAILMLVWVLGTGWQNYRLESEIESAQSRIVEAFHRGLPEEKVLIDALVQLRRATGNGAGGVGSDAWMIQLTVMARSWQQMSWQLHEFEYRDARAQLSGETGDLKSVNKIRQALREQSGQEVELIDTDIRDDRVLFRMRW